MPRARREAAEREREHRVKAAAQAERQRIATEIHDVLAHSLTLIHARSTAGLITLDADPSSARDALNDVRATASEALTGVRSLVGTLAGADASARPTVAEEGTTPAGDLRDIPALLDRFRASGLPVRGCIPTLPELATAQEHLPVLVRLAVLRVLEEALTNVLRHGDPAVGADLVLALDGPVRLEVCNRIRDDLVSPTDAPAVVGTGTGLTGLTARLSDLGGTLQTDISGGHFELAATIPLHNSLLREL